MSCSIAVLQCLWFVITIRYHGNLTPDRLKFYPPFLRMRIVILFTHGREGKTMFYLLLLLFILILYTLVQRMKGNHDFS